MIKNFFFKVIIYALALGIPLALLSFLVLGVIWLGKQVFS